MNENNNKTKDDNITEDKKNKKKFNSSIISPKKEISQNYIRNKTSVLQVKIKPLLLYEENNNQKNEKFNHNSPDIKVKTNELNNLKLFQNNSQKEKRKYQKYSNHLKTENDSNAENNNDKKNKEENKSLKSKNKRILVNHKTINFEKNKVCEDNNNNSNNSSSTSMIISHSQNTKKIKINTIINNTKNVRQNNNEKKKTKLSKESIKKNNFIDNFKVEECDENIEQNKNNAVKKYSLTNQNILPCIPFSNPFSNKNKFSNNINANEINENLKENKNNKKIEKEIIENNTFNGDENKDKDEDEEDVKLNISNLDIDVDQMNDEIGEESNSRNELPLQLNNINNHYNFKSFIQFNNNLSIKLAAEKSKNTPSYLLALCPKLYMGYNKKNKIIENYAVNDAISEEMESDTLTPKNSKTKNSFEEKNTKYSTKEKNSDRNKKQQMELDSEEGSYEEDKKTIYNNSNSERKNKNNIYKNIYPQKKQKIYGNTNNTENIIINENNVDENKKTIINEKINKKKKKLNIKDINIETENINNINNVSLSNDIKNSPFKRNNFYTSPNKSNISFHFSNNTINKVIYNETENNNCNYNKIRAKILKLKNNDYKERHQKAKSLMSNVSLSTLYLYETIQNNNTNNNNVLTNKKKKLFKSNIKSTDYRNKILNKEKKIVENENNGNLLNKKKSNEKYISNNNRTNSYKNNEDKITNSNNGCIGNNISNKKKMKKIPFSHLLKSPKYKVNPFLSNFSNNNDKSNYIANNNEILYTLHNTEYKYSYYYELFKKRNNNYKISNTNNTISTINNNNELSNNFTNEISVNHCKKISQQFIDEYNLLLETKSDNNNMSLFKNKKINNSNEAFNTNCNLNKNNILNKYFSYNKNQKMNSKEALDINNKSVKFKNKVNNENSNMKKISQITPCHKKSKTFFISPSYVSKNINNKNNNGIDKVKNSNIKENKNNGNSNIQSKYNLLINKTNNNNKKKNVKTINKNNSQNKYNKNIEVKPKKNNNEKIKFKEIKKIIGETSLTKIIHRKTNTIGSTNIISNFLCNNFFNYNNLIQNTNHNIYNNMNVNNSNSTRNNTSTITNKELKKAASINNLINNLGNKKKIISAMQRIKFIPVSYYSKTIKEMIKSKNNIFVLLVYKDQNQRYVFRGLYEILEKDPRIAIKLFAPNYGQNIINVNNINYFYNYSFSRGDFIRYKFIDEKNKKFNEDTIIIF